MRSIHALILVAALGVTGCGNSRASAPAANESAATAKAGHAPRAVLLQSAEPYPRVGHCVPGACAWFETHEQRAIGSSEYERLIRIDLATGRSSHAGDELPSDASRVDVEWASRGERAYVFCSRWRPSVIRRGGSEWQSARIDLLRGMGDFETSSQSIYGLVCHPGGNWLSDTFFARNRYRPQPSEPVQRVAHPESVTFIHPHDPERPEMGGMAVSHSAPAEAVSVGMPAPPPAPVIEYRPPPRPPERFHLLAISARGEIVGRVGTYPSLEACERERAARSNVESPPVCISSEQSLGH